MYSSVLTALRSGIALLFVLSTFYCKAQDTLFLTTGRKLIGKVICEDDVQYCLDKYQGGQLVHFSVLKNGVSNANLHSNPPFLTEGMVEPVDEAKRLWSAGFYLAKPIFNNLSKSDYYESYTAFDVGIQIERKLTVQSHLSVSMSPGLSFVTTSQVGYRGAGRGYGLYEDSRVLIQIPIVTQYISGIEKGFLASVGANVNTDFAFGGLGFNAGPKVSVGYAFRAGYGDTMRLEYFVDSRGSGGWFSGVKASLIFGNDRKVMRISHFPL